eukprot:618164-Prymnesium_polylepis.1
MVRALLHVVLLAGPAARDAVSRLNLVLKRRRLSTKVLLRRKHVLAAAAILLVVGHAPLEEPAAPPAQAGRRCTVARHAARLAALCGTHARAP